MNVLSLFDGMSCGNIALERAGIEVENYFASEVDTYAMFIAKKQYPNIKHIGDVTKVNGIDLPKIDLLIGGSPCQGFSFSGKQLNFEDERSKLFFEYARLLKECEPTYFLLENVIMKKEYQNIISSYLGVEPVEINSECLTAQNRRRLYWTNIPNIKQPENKGILLKDIFEYDTNEKIYTEPYYKKVSGKSFVGHVANKPTQATTVFTTNGKSVCLTALGGGQGGKTGLYEIPNTNTCRKLTPTECEKLQTVPLNYTLGVSNSQRYKMLGNGWTVDVIAYIFKGLTEEPI
jgi:DNA-cytosine methyltransferase